MLTIVVPAKEAWDEKKEVFVYTKETKLQLEHSLVSIQKWEAKWKIPFLTKEPKTFEQTIDYVRCMTITQNVKDEVYQNLTAENLRAINDYIGEDMTATWFSEEKFKKPNRQQVTAELIYYWMVALQIPHEYRKWHLNQLITLIRVTEAEQTPSKKRPRNQMLSERRALNEARKAKLHTKG